MYGTCLIGPEKNSESGGYCLASLKMIYPPTGSTARCRLTNREKRNFMPRGYAVTMFPDVGKLDQVQYRPEAFCSDLLLLGRHSSKR
jgi:hypothetical protein